MKFKRYKTYLIFGPTSIGKTSSLNKFKDIAETFDYSSFLNKKLDLYNRVLSDSSKKPIVITTHPSTENKSYAILYKINKRNLKITEDILSVTEDFIRYEAYFVSKKGSYALYIKANKEGIDFLLDHISSSKKSLDLLMPLKKLFLFILRWWSK